jgi:hypothetical protein
MCGSCFKSMFSLFFAFFSLFFTLNFSLRFDLVIFALKRNKAKRNSSLFFRFFRYFSLFSLFSLLFTFFHFFSLFFAFHFASIFSLNFCIFYLRFRFRFLVFRIEVDHVKSAFFFASKGNEIFASISNFASEAKVRAHLNLTLCRLQSRPNTCIMGNTELTLTLCQSRLYPPVRD